MIDLKNPFYVKALQSTLRAKPLTDPDVMKFMEKLCGWYDFNELETNTVLINTGKRQVLATIKTLLELTTEQIVALAKEREG